jgi:hypothetical protein
MGAVAWGPMAIAPFPIPARQTGQADFRHPAFRLASPQGTRRDRSGQALEAQNAEFSMNDIECESAIAAPLHLVPSRQEPAHTFKDILVDATVCPASRSQSSWSSLAVTRSACHIFPAMDRYCSAPEDRRSLS